MAKEIRADSLVEVYNKYLPFFPKKYEGTSIGVIVHHDVDGDSFEVMVEGIRGHAGSSHTFVENRWYIPRIAIKGTTVRSNYIKEEE